MMKTKNIDAPYAGPEGAGRPEGTQEDRSFDTIAVAGLGYVGLPLSLQFARSGVSVLGLDIDTAKVEALNRGESYIKHIESSAVGEIVDAKKFMASTDFSRVADLGGLRGAARHDRCRLDDGDGPRVDRSAAVLKPERGRAT